MATHLDRNPATQHVIAHAAAVLKASHLFQQIVPASLARSSRVANVRTGIVIIHTEHGAAANKLKQQTQQLVDAFVKRGFECTGIEIRVQPAGAAEPRRQAFSKPIGEQALTSLQETARKMRDGTPLKARIEHLIARAARKV